MKNVKIGNQNVSSIVVGCMRIGNMSQKDLIKLIEGSAQVGANFFDHADIYGGGKCEEVFGKALRASSLKREDVVIQSKMGIKKGLYDQSKEHIINSVDGILKRLDMDYLDYLLIHRPDALVEPEEVAEAFDTLEKSGKVRNFGVSNHKPAQIELLKKYVKQGLNVNQLQLSLPVSNMIANGIEVNMDSAGSVNHDGDVLDYSRLKDITIQAWSPFQMPNWKGIFFGAEEYKELNTTMAEMAEKYNATETMIATAWILRHPANMQVISGTTKIDRVKEMARASEIKLSREDWYKLYLSAGHILP